MSDVSEALHAYISREFLPPDAGVELADDTPLVATGILDSVSTLRLLSFIEERFGVEFAPHEIDAELFADIATISAAIAARRKG